MERTPQHQSSTLVRHSINEDTQHTLDHLCEQVANHAYLVQDWAHRLSDVQQGAADCDMALKANCTKALWALDLLRTLTITFADETP
jgi:hypothetical protein